MKNSQKIFQYVFAIACLFVIYSVSNSAFAQKFAFVDSDYILKNMPEYQAAKKQLDNISIRWQAEIDAKIAELQKKRAQYDAEKVLLTDDMRIQREDELSKLQNDILELQRKRFGPKGDLIQKQAELIKPIQDKVHQTIQTIAENKNYGMIFDKAGSTTVMYGNDRFDISDQILKEMGIEPGANIEDEDADDVEKGEGVIERTREQSKDVINRKQ
ncbi:MAG TPA: OmpH family outer membrane protein [Bacteroidia bacterium]